MASRAARKKAGGPPPSVRTLLARAASENGKAVPSVTPGVMKALLDHDWPGNVRELENVLERALVLGHGVIDLDQLPDTVRRSVPRAASLPAEGLSFKDAVSAYERALLSAALQRASGVQKRAAELLGLKPTTLNEMLKRHGMLPRDAKEANEPEPASPSRVSGP